MLYQEKYARRNTDPVVQKIDFAKFVKIIEKKPVNPLTRAGTGRTYASAFAMRELDFKKVLFVVHRNQSKKGQVRGNISEKN